MARILVVEDNTINRITVEHMLGKLGHVSLSAENGQQGLDALRTGPMPDLVLMDIEMPVMGGLEALRVLRSEPTMACHSMPVVAMTAHDSAQDRNNMLQAGFDGVLCKPLDAAKLAECIEVHLRPKKSLPAPSI